MNIDVSRVPGAPKPPAPAGTRAASRDGGRATSRRPPMIKRTLHVCTTSALALAIAWAFGGCIISKKQTVHEEPQPTVIHEKEVIQTPPAKEKVIIHEHD